MFKTFDRDHLRGFLLFFPTSSRRSALASVEGACLFRLFAVRQIWISLPDGPRCKRRVNCPSFRLAESYEPAGNNPSHHFSPSISHHFPSQSCRHEHSPARASHHQASSTAWLQTGEDRQDISHVLLHLNRVSCNPILPNLDRAELPDLSSVRPLLLTYQSSEFNRTSTASIYFFPLTNRGSKDAYFLRDAEI